MYYLGTAEQKNALSIAGSNEELNFARWHYGNADNTGTLSEENTPTEAIEASNGEGGDNGVNLTRIILAIAAVVLIAAGFLVLVLIKRKKLI